ncbi:MAG TPA: type II secretion system F family protein, partial [Streptosporangiaceae bacterium]
LAVRPGRPTISAALAQLDASRAPSPISAAFVREGLTGWRGSLGTSVARALANRGVVLTSTRSDLNVLGRSMEGFLATTVILGVCGLLFGPIAVGLLYVIGLKAGPALPLALAIVFAVFAAAAPTLELRSQAAKRRRDFRHATGAFLDLVAMNLAGGRGVPEALTTAAQVGGGWPFARLRDTLAFARLQGLTPWAALGRLGEELDIEELRDLSAALTLVADDGAKIRASLSARAATLRRRELAEAEGKAGERSQSMLIAQLLICFGFLLFLAYPAVYNIFNVS